MMDLDGKVAVITGGASGMGRAMAERFAAAGMAIVLADVEATALDEAVATMSAAGAQVAGVVTDVSSAASMADLRRTVAGMHPAVHVVCLNAGVGGGGSMVDCSLGDWEWTLGVNVFGIIHGINEFLPVLIEQDEGHVVVTASIAGHTSYPGMGPYNASKHAAVAIAETLHNELVQQGSSVGATCLCPGFVATNIFTSERNRPERYSQPLAEAEPTDDDLARGQALQAWMSENAMKPGAVADLVHEAVLRQQFWVFTDDMHRPAILERHDSIAKAENPVIRVGITDPIFEG